MATRARAIGMAENVDPAISLNAAATAARGVWLHPVDGDDAPPVIAAAWLFRKATTHDAVRVFGESRRGLDPAPIPDAAAGCVVASPLALAARG